MGERRGIDRLRWLQERPSDPTEFPHLERVPSFKRMYMLSPGEIEVEVAYALIEELHDALNEFRNPVAIIKSGANS